jgi:autotransporter-associated beta strand protein
MGQWLPSSRPVAQAATPITWTGGGGTGFWSTAANWDLNRPPTAGDTLVFPQLMVATIVTNDLPPGIVFHDISFTGGDYTVNGNSFSVSDGITLSPPAGHPTVYVQNDVVLAASQTFGAQGTAGQYADLRFLGGVDLNGFTLTLRTDQGTQTDIDRIYFGKVGNPGGVIGGNGSIVKQGDGTAGMLGTSSNTYTGTTTVNGGVYQLDRTNGAISIPGDVIIGDGAGGTDADYVYIPNEPEQIADSAAVTMNAASGALVMGGATETIGSLSGGGNVYLQGSELVVGFNGASTSFSGVISGDGTPPSSAGSVTKVGTGTLTLGGNNDYNGPTTIQQGVLLVNGSQPFSAIIVAGGTLGGTGTVGPISGTSGVVGPGASPGVLAAAGNTSLAGLTFAVELNGPATPAYDQLRVQGSVALSGGTLSPSLGFTPTGGSSFTIIDNDGTADPVVGAFAGLAEGAALTVGGKAARISYVGGDGNDVVLTIQNVPPTAADDSATTAEDTAVGVAVLSNDSDPDGTLAPGSVAVTSGPSHGTAAVDPVSGAITYTPAANYAGPDSLTYTVRDAVGAVSNAATVSLTVTAVNDAPVNTVPGAQMTSAGTALAFGTANGNAISVADVDAGTGSLTVTLSVTGGTGTLTLGGTTNLVVSGNGTASVAATGSLADLNGGLQGATFTPATGFAGPTTLTVTTNDQGNTGAGGPLVDTDTIQITVGASTTSTPTPTPTGTPASTSTPTPTSTTTATPTLTATATSTPVPIPAASYISPGDDDTDKPRKETDEDRQQRQRTNTGNKDDVYIEGNVVEVHQDEVPPYVVIANKDGLVRVNLLCGSQCPTIRVGDYLEADGEKQHEQLFDATDVSVRRGR